MNIVKKDCESAWISVLQKLITKGLQSSDGSSRTVYEAIGARIKILNPTDYKKPMEKMIAKMDFIYPKTEELEQVALGKVKKVNFSQRMHDYKGFNQIEDYVIPLLKNRPLTRRAITVNYDPSQDSVAGARSAISLLAFHFRIIEDKLALTVFVRSLDCFLGLPANFVHAASIQKRVAEQIKCNIGSLTFLVGSAHLYKDHEKLVEKII